MERAPDNQQQKEAASKTLDDLWRQIEDHQYHDKQQSLLNKVVGTVWGGDKDSLNELTNLYDDARTREKAGDTAGVLQLEHQIQDKIKDDKHNIGVKDEITRYGG